MNKNASNASFGAHPLTSPYMRVRQAAAYLGLSKSTLDKLRIVGSGPRYAKAGRIVVYARADLDDWLTARTRHSTSETE